LRRSTVQNSFQSRICDTPLYLAVKSQRLQVAKLLLEHGADVNREGKNVLQV
jgi:ankyrin repeat protein